MDTAVALVQAYLNVDGYFTVVESSKRLPERTRQTRSESSST